MGLLALLRPQEREPVLGRLQGQPRCRAETGIIAAALPTPANAADDHAGVALLAGEEPGLHVLA